MDRAYRDFGGIPRITVTDYVVCHIIRNQEGGNPAQEREAVDMGSDPAGQLLAWGGFGEHVGREPQDGDEDLGIQRHLPLSGDPGSGRCSRRSR